MASILTGQGAIIAPEPSFVQTRSTDQHALARAALVLLAGLLFALSDAATAAAASPRTKSPSSALKLRLSGIPPTAVPGTRFRISTRVENPHKRASRRLALEYYVAASTSRKATRTRLVEGRRSLKPIKRRGHVDLKHAVSVPRGARLQPVWVFVCVQPAHGKRTRSNCAHSARRMQLIPEPRVVTDPVPDDPKHTDDTTAHLDGSPPEDPGPGDPGHEDPGPGYAAADALFAAAYLDRASSATLVRELLAQRVLAATFRLDAGLSARAAVQLVADVRTAWDVRMNDDATLIAAGTFLDTVRSGLPVTAQTAVGDVLRDLRVHALRERREEIAAGDILGFARDSVAPRHDALALDTARSMRRFARQSGSFANAWDSIFGATVGLDIGADIQAIIAASPGLRANSELIARLLDTTTGAIHADAGTLEREIDAIQDTVNQATSDTIAASVPGARTAAPPASPGIDKARIGLKILTELLVLTGHEEQAKKLDHIVSTALQVYQAVVVLKPFLAGIGSSGAVAALATAGAVVVVGGAVIALSAYVLDRVVSSAVKKQTDQLMAQVKALESLVRELIQHVAVLTDLVRDGFAQVNLTLSKLVEGQRETQARLIALSGLMDRLRGEVGAQLEEGFGRDLLNAIDEYLGYESRTGSPLPPADARRAESIFFVWATTHAFDSVSTGPAARPTGDENLASELTIYQSGLVGYLSDVLARWGLKFVNGRAPSPRVFQMAARAYQVLLLENPDLAATIDRGRLATIVGVGSDLQTDLTAIQNPAIISRVADHSAAMLDVVSRAIGAKEETFLDDRGVKLFGGSDQSTAAPSGWPPNGMRCRDGANIGGGLSDSTELLPNPYRVLVRLGAGQVRGCVDGRIQNAEQGSTHCNGQHRIRKWRVYARYSVAVRIGDGGWREVRVRDATSGYYQRCQTFPNDDEVLNQAWPELIGLLNAAPTSHVDGSAFDEARARDNAVLRDHQGRFYASVATWLNNGDLQTAAIKVQGASALMRATSSLGFPQASSSDAQLRRLLDASESANLIAAYSAAAQSPPGGNARGEIIARLHHNGYAWRDVVKGYIDQIAAKTRRDRLMTLQSTMIRLQGTWALHPAG